MFMVGLVSNEVRVCKVRKIRSSSYKWVQNSNVQNILFVIIFVWVTDFLLYLILSYTSLLEYVCSTIHSLRLQITETSVTFLNLCVFVCCTLTGAGPADPCSFHYATWPPLPRGQHGGGHAPRVPHEHVPAVTHVILEYVPGKFSMPPVTCGDLYVI